MEGHARQLAVMIQALTLADSELFKFVRHFTRIQMLGLSGAGCLDLLAAQGPSRIIM